MSKKRQTGTLFVLIAFVVLYCAGYGAMRWRKVLVRSEVYASMMPGGEMMPPTTLVRDVIPGHDMRSTGIGAFKNRIARPVATFYTPLRVAEAAYWNSRSR